MMGMANALPINECRGSGKSERIFVSREGAKAQRASAFASLLRVFASSRENLLAEARLRGNASAS